MSKAPLVRLIGYLDASGICEYLSRPRARVRLSSMNGKYGSKSSLLSKALLLVKRLTVSGKVVCCDCS